MFATRFRYIEVPFDIFYYQWGEENCYVKDFVIQRFIKSRFYREIIYMY